LAAAEEVDTAQCPPEIVKFLAIRATARNWRAKCRGIHETLATPSGYADGESPTAGSDAQYSSNLVPAIHAFRTARVTMRGKGIRRVHVSFCRIPRKGCQSLWCRHPACEWILLSLPDGRKS
jgi:hypothetical protein